MNFMSNNFKIDKIDKITKYNTNTIVLNSSPIIINDIPKKEKENIYLIYQYYLPSSKERIKEVQEALRRNIDNPYISKIYILNERHYTDEEFGLKNHTDKIVQIITGVRMMFKDVFMCVEKYKLKGYIITSNSDIFFDDSISKLHYTDLSVSQKLISLLRWEYCGEKELKKCKLYGPSNCSQDSWIFHSNFNLNIDSDNKLFDIYFGQPGCDNKVLYNLIKCGFLINNNPIMFKSYHCHDNSNRQPYKLPRIYGPYAFVNPEIINK
jgi:hypothetical protein